LTQSILSKKVTKFESLQKEFNFDHFPFTQWNMKKKELKKKFRKR